MSNNPNQISNDVAATSPQTKTEEQQKVIRRFQIAVYDLSYNEHTGKDEYQRVSYSQPVIIEASTQKELQEKLNMYKQCGQIAKIEMELPPLNAPVAAPKFPDEKPIQSVVQPVSVNNVTAQNPVQSVVEKQTEPIVERTYVKPEQKPIKYYKIGDVEIKDDNGKIYQKQWVKLTETESSNLRIVNSKTNAIFPLTNKHIEMKKWIRVEDQKNDEVNIEEHLQ